MNTFPHREYSFMFHAGHLEQIPHETTTGTIQLDAGLTEAQVSALHTAFSTHAFSGPQGPEGYVLDLDDDCSLRVRLWDAADYKKMSSIPVELIALDLHRETLRTILEIALSANMILIDITGKKVRYVGRDPNPQDIDKWSDAVRIDTVEELRSWLTEDIVGRPVDMYPEEYD